MYTQADVERLREIDGDHTTLAGAQQRLDVACGAFIGD
jgi:hypothetical protein